MKKKNEEQQEKQRINVVSLRFFGCARV